MELNEITEKIIGAAIEVHRLLGPGLLESAYEECLCYELSQAGLHFQRQLSLPILYKGLKLATTLRMDVLVEDSVVVELKTADDLLPIHKCQLLTYLKTTHKPVGLLINFNVPVLKNGIKRMVNHHIDPIEAPTPSVSSAPNLGDLSVSAVIRSPR
jgi:GxxExxY protein